MKILVVLPRFPYPLEKGDKLRAFHQIRSLSKNHEIILFALNDVALHRDALEVLGRYCAKIQVFNISRISILWNLIKVFFNGKPFQVGYFYNSKARDALMRIIGTEKPDHIYCQLIRVAEYIKNIPIPKTLDYQDAFSVGMERRYAGAPFYKRPVFKMELERLVRYEIEVFGYFDNKIIISGQDRDQIKHPDNHQIHVVRNGVDFDFFKPVQAEKTTDLVFTGNMNYPPNVDSALFLVKKILPLLLPLYPKIRILIAGATPSQVVQSLASDNVKVTGWVDDIRKCYAGARIFIAPMQLGSGLQNKLLEAMSMKVPCISSSLANNSLKAEENKEILIGKTPEEYVKHIETLLGDTSKAEELAENGYRFVLKNYSWEKHNTLLEEIIINASYDKSRNQKFDN